MHLFRMTIVCLLFALPAALAGSSPHAAVSWVLFDNREDFQKSPQRIRTLLSDQQGEQSLFGIPPSRVFETPTHAPLEDFGKQISNALAVLRNEQDPILVVFIDSHGSPKGIARQNGPEIPHAILVDLLLDQVDAFQRSTSKVPTVELVYSACYAHSILPSLRQRMQTGQTHE